jgi:hypothetical protein
MGRIRLSVLWISGAAIAALPAAAGAHPACEGKRAANVKAVRGAALVMSWKGQIREPMAECIQSAFDRLGRSARYVILTLDSEGGRLRETDRVFAVLEKIKRTHPLQTLVDRGGRCWSACVAVFLAGQQRIAALTSTWMFHEVWAADAHGSPRLDRARSDRVFDRYYLAAGVSRKWLERLYLLIPHSDYWQTGQNLWDDKSGIITHTLDNLVPNNTERRKY